MVPKKISSDFLLRIGKLIFHWKAGIIIAVTNALVFGYLFNIDPRQLSNFPLLLQPFTYMFMSIAFLYLFQKKVATSNDFNTFNRETLFLCAVFALPTTKWIFYFILPHQNCCMFELWTETTTAIWIFLAVIFFAKTQKFTPHQN